MSSIQEESIVKNIHQLTNFTQNLPELVQQLVRVKVLTENDMKQIALSDDYDIGCNLLYEMIMQKPPECFSLLLVCLRNTNNVKLAALLENSMGSTSSSDKRRIRRHSSVERFMKDEVSLSVSGGEMGIAEFLEEYPHYGDDCTNLFFDLELSEANLGLYESQNDFVTKATFMLKDWVEMKGNSATVANLCKIFMKAGLQRCTERIKNMFEIFEESCLQLDSSEGFPIKGKERKIAAIIDENPSFCCHPIRLFLLLNLPLSCFKDAFRKTTFLENAIYMLGEWSHFHQSSTATTASLAGLLAYNGHVHTAEKLMNI